MKLSEENKNTLLTCLHKLIEEGADRTANFIHNGQASGLIVYPPNGGFTEEEMKALEQLKGNDPLRDALRKILADHSAAVIFHFLNIIDGTGDPDPQLGKWSEVMLVDHSADFEGNTEFLHDSFFATYWEWRKLRNADYTLDLLDD